MRSTWRREVTFGQCTRWRRCRGFGSALHCQTRLPLLPPALLLLRDAIVFLLLELLRLPLPFASALPEQPPDLRPGPRERLRDRIGRRRQLSRRLLDPGLRLQRRVGLRVRPRPPGGRGPVPA